MTNPMCEKLEFWFYWDEDITYNTLNELNEIYEKGGLTNYLFTLREILQGHWEKYQKQQ